ncbi:pyridoxamine 5'-phosphate oxidase family protein [Luteolibacter sp. SL250]|uniref:pyridoxamine 5'-phosphate oxidase family protein n=1 Tax=Luteolibacter sp. SL250 TaxID=2995170 RepID=UPI00226D7EC3|nr:pyridoxamine 5'-phosphate oxidase family protein [Luteolibacter sp. SL250]WAC17792.1 pyridoxamine 5'-phosphate oxidase family protein [Luteolibacter sp. SL250]
MDKTENLVSAEAVLKLRDLTTHCPTCMFGTDLTATPMHVCPMHTQQVDDAGSLWFFSGLDSEHVGHIRAGSQVQLIYSNPSKYEFLTVFGDAEIVDDPAKVEELWKPLVKAWFPEGKEDPNLTLIRVDPLKAHYWDTKDGKLVVLAKILVGTVTGKVEDGGVQGDLRV